MAVRFSPPFEQSNIISVRYWIQQDPAKFNVLIMDSNRKPIYEKSATPTDTGWFAVNLSEEKILMQGDFYAAMQWTESKAPSLGTDYSDPDGRSFWVSKDGTWTAFKEDPATEGKDADFMIRVTVAPAFILNIKSVLTKPSSDESFYVGDIGTVTYTLENAGMATARNVGLRVVKSPAEVEIVEVTPPSDLKSGATHDWQVKLEASKPGSYEISISFYIDDEKQSFKVEGTDEIVDEFTTTIAASERPFLETYGLYIGGAVIAVVVILVAVLMMRRRSGRAAASAPVFPAAPMPTPTPEAPSIAPPPTQPSAGKFCINCGAPMPVTGKFCAKCGSQQP
jgi:hypothetical protein